MDGNIRQVAIGATLHCITGCAIGEILGLIIGTAFGLTNLVTIIISIALAFLFGYSLSMLPLLKAGLTVSAALSVVAVSDTVSIATMELADNAVMALIPGAMNAGLVNPLFWATMPISLLIAFFVAVPVNEYLLKRGKGHALIHKQLHGGH
ncbi:MAG: DUF4396 domain-containing protein [Patescibacteria group bacterium]|nr:DUF4396 domain-containing protein [Patescibacteria group bacterium]